MSAEGIPVLWAGRMSTCYYCKECRRGNGNLSRQTEGDTMKITIARIAALTATLLTVPAIAAEQIKVVERPVGETTVDLGAKGDSIGDLLVFANGIFDAANKAQIGSDQGYCVRIVVGKSWECNWTMMLKGGQITVEGAFMDEGDSLLTITGGTGKY